MKRRNIGPIRALCNSLPGGVAELARECGVTRQTVYGWISGRKLPGPKSKQILVDKFSLDISQLTEIDCATTDQQWGDNMDLVKEMVQLMRETVEMTLKTVTGRMEAWETSSQARLHAIEDRLKLMSENILTVEKNSGERNGHITNRMENMEDRLTVLTKRILGDMDAGAKK